MPQPQPVPAWASTSVSRSIGGSVRAGTVLAASEAASYVELPDDDAPGMLALLAPGAIRLPIGVCVTEGSLPERGATVQVGAGVVASGERAWRPVRWWDPRPRVAVDALLTRGGVLVDLVRAEPARCFGMPLPDALDVAAGLAAGDCDAALGVLGLGPGLTPAGDDVVAGAFAVLALAGRLDDSVRDVVESHARTRTTGLSSALVAAAGRGEMIPQAARLLMSLAAGDPPDRLAEKARALFGVGSTSGHDLAAGMAGALEALK